MTSERIDFFKKLLNERWQMMPLAESNAFNRAKDKNGCYTNGLASHHRFIGITEFLVAHDVDSFRKHLSKCAELRLTLFHRFDEREPIDPSYVSMLAYKALFDALAAGNFPLATALARAMGDRPEIEKEHDHPFDRAMGYALKTTVLMDKDEPARTEFNRVLANAEDVDFRGYTIAFDGIASRDDETFNRGLASVIDGHLKQAKQGVFEGTDDEDLCVWGVGLANLASSRGLTVRVNSELIPDVLIV